jgi:hypothetical protein
MSFEFNTDAIMRGVMERVRPAAEERVRQKVAEVLGPVDAAKVIVTFHWLDKDMTVHMQGPDELKAKAQPALNSP